MTKVSSLAGRRVARMNGAGNKILVLDLRDGAAAPTPQEARAIHRSAGLDYDQLMVLQPARSPETLSLRAHLQQRRQSRRGLRQRHALRRRPAGRETGRDRLMVETERGLIACERLGEWSYRVDMGAPRLGWSEIPFAVRADTVAAEPVPGGFGPAGLVNMGNPHAVLFVADLDAVDLARDGPALETHPLFPEKANISFAQVLAPDRIRLKVWERGVGATLACGSAACAALVAASRRGLTGREAVVELPGGRLTIAWRSSDGHVLMTGPVEFEREIELAPSISA